MDDTLAFALRPARTSDREALFALFRSAMRDVITRTWGWDESWQRAHFDAHFDPAQVSVVCVGGREVGVLRLEARPGELYVAELQIAPDMQGRGLGSAVVRGVVEEAAARGACVTLQVIDVNTRARLLYERLGFHVTGRRERHFQMRHAAGTRP